MSKYINPAVSAAKVAAAFGGAVAVAMSPVVLQVVLWS